MNYAFLQTILAQVEAYEASGGTADAGAFGRWLAAQAGEPEASANTESPSYKLSMHVTFLYRYVKGYTRLALAGSPLSGPDDFVYLISITWNGPLTKSELIQRNIHEKATGTEVIRRLLDRGLVREEGHATDRRRKVLHATDEGRRVLGQLLGRMELVARMAHGNLTPAETRQLLALLGKLDQFHNERFRQGRPNSFADLLADWPVALAAVPPQPGKRESDV